MSKQITFKKETYTVADNATLHIIVKDKQFNRRDLFIHLYDKTDVVEALADWTFGKKWANKSGYGSKHFTTKLKEDKIDVFVREDDYYFEQAMDWGY